MTEPNDVTPTDVVADSAAAPREPAEPAAESADSAVTEPIFVANARPQDDETSADEGEFEGPRRRARRERAERRAVQARATAIEEGRREAKRRASGRIVNEPKPVARGVVRGLKMLLATVLLVIVGVGLAFAATSSGSYYLMLLLTVFLPVIVIIFHLLRWHKGRRG